MRVGGPSWSVSLWIPGGGLRSANLAGSCFCRPPCPAAADLVRLPLLPRSLPAEPLRGTWFSFPPWLQAGLLGPLAGKQPDLCLASFTGPEPEACKVVRPTCQRLPAPASTCQHLPARETCMVSRAVLLAGKKGRLKIQEQGAAGWLLRVFDWKLGGGGCGHSCPGEVPSRWRHFGGGHQWPGRDVDNLRVTAVPFPSPF